MPTDMEALLERARQVRPTEAQREEQRRSFAYGNTAIENDLITRDMIDHEAEKLKRESDDGRKASA